MARYMRRTVQSSGHSTGLRPPQVVTQPQPFIAAPVSVHVWASVHTRQNAGGVRRAPYSVLRKPSVVGAGISWHGPGVVLAAPWSLNQQNRRKPQAVLQPPAVIYGAVAFRGPRVRTVQPQPWIERATVRGTHYKLSPPVVVRTLISYGPGRRYVTPGQILANLRYSDVYSKLHPPQVVSPEAVPFVASPVATTLAPQPRGRTTWALRPPRIVATAVVYEPIRGYLFPLTLRPPITAKSRLSPPAVVITEQPFVAAAIQTTLARVTPPRTHPVLRPPTDTKGLEDQGRVATRLAYSLRGKPKSRLQPPTVVFPFIARPTQVRLARIAPPPTFSILRQPVDTVGLEDQGRVRETLAPSHRLSRRAIFRLAPPTVVFPFIARTTDTTLARIVPPQAYPRLQPPTVVFPFFARPTDVTLVRIRPLKTIARLQTPPVIAAAQSTFYGPALALTHPWGSGQQSRREPVYSLKPPTVVSTEAFVARPIDATLVRIRPRKTIAHLSPPTDTVGLEDQGRVQVHLTRGRSGPFRSRLSPPVVVFLAVEIYGPVVALTKIRVPQKRALLLPPTVIAYAALAETVVRVHLARVKPQKTTNRLQPPTVVFPFIARPTQTRLARITPPPTSSRLGPPVDTVGLEDQGRVQVRLTRGRSGPFRSRLAPPQVVFLAVELSGPEVTLAPSHRLLRQQHARLAPPVVVFLAVEIFGPVVVAARIKPPQKRALLLPPTVVASAPVVEGVVRVHLTRITPPQAYPRLQSPTVVSPVLARPIDVTLTPSRSGPWMSRLQPPTVVFPFIARATRVTLARITPPPTLSRLSPPTDTAGLEDQGRVRVTLARIVPPATRSVLQPPTVVQPFISRPIKIALARIVPPPVVYALRAPTDTVGLEDQGTVRVTLARITPAPTAATVRPPVVVEIFTAPPLRVALAEIKPQPTSKRLYPPQVVYLAVEIYGPVVALTRIAVPEKHSRLQPPTVVVPAEQVYYGPQIELAAGSRDVTDLRRKPKSALKPPTQIGPPVQFPGPGTLRARPDQRKYRRRTLWALAPPTVVAVEELVASRYTLAPQRRPVTKSVLRPPLVVHLATEIYGPRVALAPSRRPVVSALLNPPAVVAIPPFAPVRLTLARIKPQPTVSLVKPPTVVLLPPFAPVRVTLARIKQQPTAALIKPPTVVFAPFVAEPLRITLTRIVPPPVIAAVKPPSVVGEPDRFFGPFVWLAPSTRGKPRSFRILPTTLKFVPPGGDVCGFDTTSVFICYDETTTTGVFGGDSAVGGVSGSDSQDSRIDGSDSSSGGASGGDRKAT